MKKKDPYGPLKWTARIIGSLLVVFTLIMTIGELIESYQRQTGTGQASLSPLMVVIFIIWGIALAALVLAFWKEGLGGIISIGCFLLMYILNLFNKEAPVKADAFPVFLIFSIPSILYLIYWKLNKDDLKRKKIIKPEESAL